MSGIATAALSALSEAEGSWLWMDKALKGPLVGRLPKEDHIALTVGWLLQHPSRLHDTPLVWVSSEMVDLLEHAAETIPVHAFSPARLPWQDALVVLGRHLRSDDMDLNGFIWAPMSALPRKVGVVRTDCSHLLAALRRTPMMFSAGHQFGPGLWTFLSEGEPIADERQAANTGLDHELGALRAGGRSVMAAHPTAGSCAAEGARGPSRRQTMGPRPRHAHSRGHRRRTSPTRRRLSSQRNADG